MDNIFKTNY
uniref:Uncharacterized protein n=1 Tax=Arundo donax TaxID=35708 RepID=A0A0A8YC04_ARUDO